MQGTELISTPLIDYFESLGYKADSSNGRKIIQNYTDAADELNCLYDGVGLRDISHYAVFELKGQDVLDYLHRISTNQLRDLPKENVERTVFTTEKGRIIDVASIINFDSQQLCISSSFFRYKLKSWLDKYVISDDVSIIDTGTKYSLLELLGPQADSFVTLLSGSVIHNIKPGTFKVFHAEGILFFLLKFLDQNNKLRYWFISDQENGKQLVNYMISNKGLFDFYLVGEEAYNAYRIEQGIPSAPNELNDEYNPHEARLMDIVNTKKGCYIGQEVIARLDTYDKVQKVLTNVKISSDVNPGNFLLMDETGADAGRLTSVVFSSKCKRMIGLAYIKRAYYADGRELRIKDSDTTVTVKIRK